MTTLLNRPLLEIATYSAEAAIIAANAGADRIELCSSPAEGGLTPGIGTIRFCCEYLKIPVHVMARPREGDFLYSANEFHALLMDIEAALKAGASGIVCGFLTSNGKIDSERLKVVRELTRGYKLTFHRAFDVSANLAHSLITLIENEVDLVLTSGGCSSAEEGMDVIASLNTTAENRIGIMPACGINEANFMKIAHSVMAKHMHLSAKKRVPGHMNFSRQGVSMGIPENDTGNNYYLPDFQIIKTIKVMLDNNFGLL